tara:strand:+ start:287 stop:586 length:300 start_codon:yes stop_codon:yes gene_type:complete
MEHSETLAFSSLKDLEFFWKNSHGFCELLDTYGTECFLYMLLALREHVKNINEKKYALLKATMEEICDRFYSIRKDFDTIINVSEKLNILFNQVLDNPS